MGWYATISGGVEYKYGNAVTVANACRLGTLSVTPRMNALDEGGDRIEDDDIEFMGPLQARIKQLGLPWNPDIVFDEKYNESVAIELDATPRALLKRFGEQILNNKESVLTAIAKTVDDAPEIVELGVTIEFDWSLPIDDHQKLVDWLNAELEDDVEKISLELLRRGTRGDDDARLLAVHALAQAVLSGEKVSVDTPDDDFQLTVWNRDGIVDEDDDEEDDDD